MAFDAKQIFFIDQMITPKIITFIYWLLLLGAAVSGLLMMVFAFGAMRFDVLWGLGLLVLSPLVFVLGALSARVYCELMIVLFKMLEALQGIRDKG